MLQIKMEFLSYCISHVSTLKMPLVFFGPIYYSQRRDEIEAVQFNTKKNEISFSVIQLICFEVFCILTKPKQTKAKFPFLFGLLSMR